MSPKNLSEELFKPRFKHPETSSLMRRVHHHPFTIHSAPDGAIPVGWYRMIDRLLWAWRGLSPQEIIEVLARIAVSTSKRTDERLLDTVIGYRGGNWIYEWSKQAARWQQKASQCSNDQQAGRCWLQAANLFSVASYPHLKEDKLAGQAQLLASRAYQQSALLLPGELKELEFAIADGSPLSASLHMPPDAQPPYPTVLMCGSLDSLQSDHYRLFHDYLAPRGIALLTLDMPSVGFSAKWKLTQDTSFLHQQVLRQLENVAWIDHTRVAAFGFRFGANVAVRLGCLETQRLRAVACIGPLVHRLLTDRDLQHNVPDMHRDMLASRLGMSGTSDSTMRAELCRFSLKMQGLLGRRSPTPMLSAYWPHDPFSPEEESRLIVNSSVAGRLLKINPSPAVTHFDKALRDICDWLFANLSR
ncbi:esterase FrsA [Erwinia amylovora]|uniref:esterase FrsA n=1 Tax=Erwinia amylovora TaxID=552 RepID=UPI00320819CF